MLQIIIFLLVWAFSLLLAVLAIANCNAGDMGVPRAYFPVDEIWRIYQISEVEGDRAFKRNVKLPVVFHADTIDEIQGDNRVILYVGSPSVGRVQLDFKNGGRPLNLQPVRGQVFAECRLDGLSVDSTLLLEDCELE